MKKIILSFLLIFLMINSFSQELNGFKLGSTYNGDFKINEVGTRYAEINSTFGEVNGVLSISLTKNKIIAIISFEKTESISQTAFNHIKKEIEDKHNISFFELDKNSYIHDGQNTVYLLHSLDKNGVSLVIMDKDLSEEMNN